MNKYPCDSAPPPPSVVVLFNFVDQEASGGVCGTKPDPWGRYRYVEFILVSIDAVLKMNVSPMCTNREYVP